MHRSCSSVGLSLLVAAGAVLAGCSDGGGALDGSVEQEVALSGAAQKGPFVIGAAVQVSVLDADLDPIGQVFNTETIDDRGNFSLEFTTSGPVAIEVDGYFFNELSGSLSDAPIKLRALFQPTGGSQSAYVNVITHLTTERIKTLVRGGASFSDAVSQAESELHAELGITCGSYTPQRRGVELDLEGGDDDDNAYLLAVGAVLLDYSNGGGQAAYFQELLNTVARDFEDGVLDADRKAHLGETVASLPVAPITENLRQRLVDTGSTAVVPDMNRVLDQDADGLCNVADPCSDDPDPTCHRGGPGQQCGFDGSCVAGYTCLPDQTSSCGGPSCCKPIQTCGAGCGPGTECLTPTDPLACNTGSCCLPVGGEHQPCASSGPACRFPMACIDPSAAGCLYGYQQCCTIVPPTTVSSGTTVALTHVWGTGPGDVWATGGTVLHWDGSQWTPRIDGLPNGRCGHVWGTGPDTVWGGCSGPYRWDGSSWSHLGAGPTEGYMVWGFGPDDLWVANVGYPYYSAAHWDGSTWSTPVVFGKYMSSSGMWGAEPDDVWFVGTMGTMRHGAGASPVNWGFSLGVHGTAVDDVWVVGQVVTGAGFNPHGNMAHWDGVSLTNVDNGTGVMLFGVWASARDDVWAVGENGVILHWDGVSWVSIPSGVAGDLEGVYANDQDVWFVGFGGTILRFQR